MKKKQQSIEQILDELDECKTEKQYIKVRDRIIKHCQKLNDMITSVYTDWQKDVIRYEKEINRLNPIDITKGC